MINIIVKTEDIALLDKLQLEFSYLIKDHELSEMEYFLDRLTHPIFYGNEIINNFIANFMDSVVRDIDACDNVCDLDILMNFIDEYDEDLIKPYEHNIKTHIVTNIDDLIENSIDNCDCDPYALECDKEKLENLIEKFDITDCDLRELENTIDELRVEQELDEANENENSKKDHLNYLRQMQDDNESIKDLFLTLKK